MAQSKDPDTGRSYGDWSERVQLSDRGFAFRPGEILIKREQRSSVLERLGGLGKSAIDVQQIGETGDLRLFFDGDVSAAVAMLRDEGLDADLNVVLFNHSCCCGPCDEIDVAAALKELEEAAEQGIPVSAGGVSSNPVFANPVFANPVFANPVFANPVFANYGKTGARPNLAEPVDDPKRVPPKLDPSPSWDEDEVAEVIVLDTGIAADHPDPARNLFPDFLAHQDALVEAAQPHEERPDEDGDGKLDGAAGHGTFIAGIVEQIAPHRRLLVRHVVTTQGDGDVATVAEVLDELLHTNRIGPRTIVNMSFGTYTDADLGVLQRAVERVQKTGAVVVASTGNDGICARQYPAAFEGVVSVGSVDPDGPAFYSNHGEWVRASAPGTDVVSSFFNWDGPEPGPEDDFRSQWARWTGTSFSAPIVAGVLAHWLALRPYATAAEAVAAVVDAPGLYRLPNYGAVINVSLS